MYRIYALEPDCYVEWGGVGLLHDAFGFDKGRLVSRFPSDWLTLVKQRIQGMPHGLKMKDAEIRLQQMRRRLIPEHDRSYDRSKVWIENATHSHSQRNFACVICRQQSGMDSSCLGVDELSETDERWRSKHDEVVDRTPTNISKAASLLIDRSREILFVDPYFMQGQKNLSRWSDSLQSFYSIISASQVPKSRVEYHVRVESDISAIDFAQKCKTELSASGFLPNPSLKILRWYEVLSKDAMHARYILTDVGGLRYDAGLDVGNPGKTTDVSLIGQALWKKRFEQYQVGKSPFKLCDVLVLDPNGTCVLTDATGKSCTV